MHDREIDDYRLVGIGKLALCLLTLYGMRPYKETLSDVSFRFCMVVLE
jgi:hypothetical protein